MKVRNIILRLSSFSIDYCIHLDLDESDCGDYIPPSCGDYRPYPNKVVCLSVHENEKRLTIHLVYATRHY